MNNTSVEYEPVEIPEKEEWMKYRVKEYVQDGKIYYIPQYKWWFFWVEIGIYMYPELKDAISELDQYRANRRFKKEHKKQYYYIANE